MWVPATMAGTLIKGSRELDDRSLRGYTVMGRLRPGAAAAAAQGELDAAMRDLAVAYPGTNQIAARGDHCRSRIRRAVRSA